MPDDLISVVVVVYNGEKTIAKTITAILRQDFSAELEVIVVDDGSTDRTPEILKTFPQIKFFRQINQGPAAARNKGAELVRGKIIFFTDSDCVPAPDWIKTNLAHYADPSVAVVAGWHDIF